MHPENHYLTLHSIENSTRNAFRPQLWLTQIYIFFVAVDKSASYLCILLYDAVIFMHWRDHKFQTRLWLMRAETLSRSLRSHSRSVWPRWRRRMICIRGSLRTQTGTLRKKSHSSLTWPGEKSDTIQFDVIVMINLHSGNWKPIFFKRDLQSTITNLKWFWKRTRES